MFYEPKRALLLLAVVAACALVLHACASTGREKRQENESNCFEKRDEMIKFRTEKYGDPDVLGGEHVPECDTEGFYQKKQCNWSTGYCWCVDRRNGDEAADSKRRGQLECDEFVED